MRNEIRKILARSERDSNIVIGITYLPTDISRNIFVRHTNEPNLNSICLSVSLSVGLSVSLSVSLSVLCLVCMCVRLPASLCLLFDLRTFRKIV